MADDSASTPEIAVSSCPTTSSQKRVLSTSDDKSGALIWKIKPNLEYLSPKWILYDSSGTARFTFVRCVEQFYVRDAQTQGIVATVAADLSTDLCHNVYIGDKKEGDPIFAKIQRRASQKKHIFISFPNSSDLPISARISFWGGRRRYYRGEFNPEWFSALNFDKDANLENLIAEVDLDTFGSTHSFIIQPGQEEAHFLPILLGICWTVSMV